MVLHPETGLDSLIGSDRDRGRDSILQLFFWHSLNKCHNIAVKCREIASLFF